MRNSLQRPNGWCPLLLGIVTAIAAQAAVPANSAADELAAFYGPGFTIRVVDQNGRPVEGALAGINVINKAPDGWIFGCNDDSRRTDADGEVRLEMGSRLVDRAAIVAIHEDRMLAGLRLPDNMNQQPEDAIYEVVVLPACRVTGRAVIRQLEHGGVSPGGFVGVAAVNDFDPFQWSSTTGDFELLLPPGKYEFHARGTYGLEVQHPLHVDAGEETLQLEPIELPPTALGLLIGNAAPELRGVMDWKNSDELKLSDLRGRYVLLYFWGHWCSPCIAQMPKLFEVRDRFPEEKLAIVGVHVGIEGEDEVDAAEKLDTALAGTRRTHWQGRDLPFPVALVKAERSRHHGAETYARSRAAADFGVRSYPTAILIDRQGSIVGVAGHFIYSDEGFAELARLLYDCAQAAEKPRSLKQPVLPTSN